MECAFDIRPLFEREIIKVQSDLLPEGFQGGPEQCMDIKRKMAWIIDKMGLQSAASQGLHTSVTSARQMCNKQTIYLMASKANESGKLVVTGLLKMGPKDLYLFDERGQLRSRIGTPAVLDFFVHGSHQRRGLGKRLFDNMLTDLGLKLCKCAVDRPSAMMTAFLAKHYGLVRTIAQANNYVLFEGFFGNNDGNSTDGKDSKPKSQLKSPEKAEKELKVLSMAEIMEAGKRHSRDNRLNLKRSGDTRSWQ
ncbi:alpha-tubulin N-acetyltransferase 1 [Drosophila novamexicana]|uniref:alpha-tubulin N-acetyltransferase 1 n=1 Tax=Drosophila novamexicana TaxID=47314 RepID=UPI0011E5E7AB|nr:alpha-tubulin N-acetyltransferase 1 [Drosophila novamexicana]